MAGELFSEGLVISSVAPEVGLGTLGGGKKDAGGWRMGKY